MRVDRAKFHKRNLREQTCALIRERHRMQFTPSSIFQSTGRRIIHITKKKILR